MSKWQPFLNCLTTLYGFSKITIEKYVSPCNTNCIENYYSKHLSQHWITSQQRKVYQNIPECVQLYQILFEYDKLFVLDVTFLDCSILCYIICWMFVPKTASLRRVSSKVVRAKWPHWSCGHITYLSKPVCYDCVCN